MRNHPGGCSKSFTNRDTLAHASATRGYVHINGAYRNGWALKKGEAGMPLLELVTHELGHSLGLTHSHNRGDLMNPTIPVKSYDSVQFSASDKRNIQAKHGAPVG